MCLAIPMRITSIEGMTADAVAGSVSKKVRLDLMEDIRVGDYVLIHTGYAIEKVDADEARETLELISKVYRAGMTGRAERDAEED